MKIHKHFILGEAYSPTIHCIQCQSEAAKRIYINTIIVRAPPHLPPPSPPLSPFESLQVQPHPTPLPEAPYMIVKSTFYPQYISGYHFCLAQQRLVSSCLCCSSTGGSCGDGPLSGDSCCFYHCPQCQSRYYGRNMHLYAMVNMQKICLKYADICKA